MNTYEFTLAHKAGKLKNETVQGVNKAAATKEMEDLCAGGRPEYAGWKVIGVTVLKSSLLEEKEPVGMPEMDTTGLLPNPRKKKRK